MNEILFVSDLEPDAELELARNELLHYGYSLSFPLSISRVLEYLNSHSYDQILINARDRKLLVLELVQNLRKQYKSKLKIFVYLPKSSANEGSKFGLLGVDVEDESSILTIVDRLPQQTRIPSEQNIISVAALHGGSGASLLSILLSYALGKMGHSSLLMDSSTGATSLRDNLVLDPKPSFLTRDRSRELEQSKDLDWFWGFISRSHFLRETFYLHLFASPLDRDNFSLKAASFSDKLSEQIRTISSRATYAQADELEASLRRASASLQMLANELRGNSYSLQEEIFQAAQQVAKYFIVDLGTDLSSALNRQFLSLTKYLFVLIQDLPLSSLKENFGLQKQYLESTYKLNIIPILCPKHYRYADYYRFTAAEWQSLLGFEPYIFPYEPEQISRFLLDHEDLSTRTSLFKFINNILEPMLDNEQPQANSRKSLLDFLVRNV